MILVWALTIIIISVLTKWGVNQLLKRQSVYLTRFVITVSCIFQFIFVYFLVKELVHYLIKAFDVFYR